VHVVYGLVKLRTHCKTALLVRREGEVVRRYELSDPTAWELGPDGRYSRRGSLAATLATGGA